ncbi:MAG TPA: hypothetical protein VGF28_02840 [Thermoanaerobaculia bacterium]|jgi:virulence-associated protein VagC
MAERAKILHNGDDQAVQLPPSCRFPDDQTEVLVRREGDRVILEREAEQNDEWPPEFLATLGALKGVELERPPQRLITEIPNPFDDIEE